jgi:hypothetical protein
LEIGGGGGVNTTEMITTKAFKWRHKDCGCELHKSWTYKRNYQAITYDIDGDRYQYLILEISDKENKKTVLAIEDFDFEYDIEERCEQLLRSLAKGRALVLNDKEKDLLEKALSSGFVNSGCEFHPENILFIPYVASEDIKNA